MKAIKIIASVVIIAALLSGCSNDTLSRLTIIEGVGIDQNKDKISLSVQYLNLETSSGTNDTITEGITSVATATQDSIGDCVAAASRVLSKKLFFGQNKIVIFGRDLVEQGIEDSVDYLMRSVDSRPDVLVAMSDTKADDVIRCNEKSAKIPAQTIYELMTNGETAGVSARVTVNMLLDACNDSLTDIYMPILSADKENVICQGIAVFSRGKYAASLNNAQTLGFLLMHNKVSDGTVSVSNREMKNVVCQILSADAKNRVVVNGNELSFISDIKVEIMLDEVQNGITTAVDEKQISAIEQLVNEYLETQCRRAFYTCVYSESDALMLSRMLAKENEGAYRSLQSNFRSSMKNIKPVITVHSRLEKINDSMYR